MTHLAWAIGWWWKRLPREHQRLVPIVAAPEEQLARVRHLVVDLEAIAVGVVEVDAPLAHVIDSADDRHAVLLEAPVRLPERLVAVDPERDVVDTDPPGRLRLRALTIFDGEEIQRVRLPLERHEDPSMLGVFFHHFEPEDARVELLGPFHVEHAHQHMADSFELYHQRLSFPSS